MKSFLCAALAEASIIIREHSPLTNLFMCLWFNEVVRFTSRDQLSFPYVLWRLKVLNDINMFPVCTRKDLVNSMGHIRKAKPLVTWIIMTILFSTCSWDLIEADCYQCATLNLMESKYGTGILQIPYICSGQELDSNLRQALKSYFSLVYKI